mgnify:CR=1 FL=1
MPLTVIVKNNNVEKAIRQLKKKLLKGNKVYKVEIDIIKKWDMKLIKKGDTYTR